MLNLCSGFSCYARVLSRQSTRYFSKKLSVTRVTNRITTWKSRQQRQRVGRISKIEQVATQSIEQHDRNRLGERHRGNFRTKGVDLPTRRISSTIVACFINDATVRRTSATVDRSQRFQSDLKNLLLMYKFQFSGSLPLFLPLS